MPKPFDAIIIPLDARPVCYQQVLQWAKMVNWEVAIPPKSILGNLKQPADLPQIKNWLIESLKNATEKTVIIASWDLLLYGGLIPSRLHYKTLDELDESLKTWLSLIEQTTPNLFGFSAIMRIPNYDNDEEEPHYWNQFGQALYQASFRAHQEHSLESFKQLPADVVEDFLNRRKINHQVNLKLIELTQAGKIQYQIFGQDDTGEYGLNVQEAKELQAQIDQFAVNSHVQTGADEVALVLLSRFLQAQLNVEPNVEVNYLPHNDCKNVMAKFDGIPIQQVVKRQVMACGGELANHSSDVSLVVFCPNKTMGDHCEGLPSKPDFKLEDYQNTYHCIQDNLSKGKAVILIDLASANGGNTGLIDYLNQQQFNWFNLSGYAAWNTPGNATGSAIAFGLSKSSLNPSHNSNAHQQWLLTRLLDDYGYQANVRTELKQEFILSIENIDNVEARLNVLMKEQESKFNLAELPIKYQLPCHRFFEVEIVWP